MRRKHGVTFDDAVLVFADPFAEIEDDSAHGPDRSTILGRSYAWKRDLLFVVYVEISGHEVRLISARHATKHERRRYEEGRKGDGAVPCIRHQVSFEGLAP